VNPQNIPVCSKYGIFTDIYPPKKGPDVGKYTSTMEDVRLVESMQIPIFDDFHIRLSQAKITKAGKPDFASS